MNGRITISHGMFQRKYNLSIKATMNQYQAQGLSRFRVLIVFLLFQTVLWF